jgi:tripeptidyl-peptidase-1
MNFSPEVAAWDPLDNFSSGGGFSSYFPRPAYQDAAISAYLASLNGTYSGLYNAAGRGYPDIAAQGFHFVTTWNGSDLWLDGTSAATPAASSVISLVNDARIAEGRPPLGFLNPWLYSGGYRAFTDVQSGSSRGCGTDGFPAKEGWDAVTGWGTPVSVHSSLLLVSFFLCFMLGSVLFEAGIGR